MTQPLIYQHTCAICGKNVIFLDTENWYTLTATKTVHDPNEHLFEPTKHAKICDECWEEYFKDLLS